MRRAGLPPKTVEDEICNKLRAMYDGVRHEPVPGQFVDLWNRWIEARLWLCASLTARK